MNSMEEMRQIYPRAYELVEHIESSLKTGLRIWRLKNGQFLWTLDQVVNAILDGTLEVDKCQNQI